MLRLKHQLSRPQQGFQHQCSLFDQFQLVMKRTSLPSIHNCLSYTDSFVGIPLCTPDSALRRLDRALRISVCLKKMQVRCEACITVEDTPICMGLRWINVNSPISFIVGMSRANPLPRRRLNPRAMKSAPGRRPARVKNKERNGDQMNHTLHVMDIICSVPAEWERCLGCVTKKCCTNNSDEYSKKQKCNPKNNGAPFSRVSTCIASFVSFVFQKLKVCGGVHLARVECSALLPPQLNSQIVLENSTALPNEPSTTEELSLFIRTSRLIRCHPDIKL